MHLTQPPYALSSTTFRFAALAALAGRSPLGGKREVVLAAFVTARLAEGLLLDRSLSQPMRADRAGHARQWLSTLALPSAMRDAFAASVDATAGDCAGVATAIRGVMGATAGVLDAAARKELEQLVEALDAAQTSSAFR